jgi:hypothetical protein
VRLLLRFSFRRYEPHYLFSPVQLMLLRQENHFVVRFRALLAIHVNHWAKTNFLLVGFLISLGVDSRSITWKIFDLRYEDFLLVLLKCA